MYQGSAPLSSVARPALLLLPTPDHLIHTPVPACPQPPPLPLARARARTERIEKESKQDRKKVATRGRSRYQSKGGFGLATRPLIGGNKVGTEMRPAERMQSLHVPSRMTNGCFVVVG